MSSIRTYPLPNSAILRLTAERKFINVAPAYQRNGDIWTMEKKRLLIDSIVNDYDIPKLYFHALSATQKKKDGGKYDYAIIDGRQRLETIWSFIDDGFQLADDIIYFADRSLDIRNLTYSELAEKQPRLKIRFDSYTLPIVCVETDDIDLIEDMFSRLNEAVPLNAAEKRSAIGGPMANSIREVADHPFFNAKIKFSDSRYRYREVAARLFFLEYSRSVYGRVLDTKKPYLDDMVRKYKEGKAKNLRGFKDIVVNTLNLLVDVFEDEDPILRSQGIIPVFYLAAQRASTVSRASRFKREKIEEFLEKVRENRDLAEADIASANFEWLEFDRMSQQGTNDAASILERERILSSYLRLT
jgi:hypothetical protein